MKMRGITARVAASVATLLAGCATQVATVPVADNLRVPANETLALETRAIGVQIYECKGGKDDPRRYEWSLKAPEAELFDTTGKKIGKHYAGPTWELNDGSKVVGEVKARDDGPDANAIPWLLLSAKSTAGAGVLAKTTSVQRLQTVGGKAPAGGCTLAEADKEVRVPYSATYNFYAARP